MCVHVIKIAFEILNLKCSKCLSFLQIEKIDSLPTFMSYFKYTILPTFM